MEIVLPSNLRVVVDPPGPAARRRLARSPRFWLATVSVVGLTAAAAWWWRVEPAEPAAGDGVPVAISSTPPGAAIQVDGRPRGLTPATLRLAPGRHRLLLHRDDSLEARRELDVPPGGLHLAADLWRREPLARRVRPTFPGATVAGATFLADGRVALSVALPPDDERQTWLLDPATDALERVGPPDARAALTVSPDGQRVAYLGRSRDRAAVGAERLDEVWLAAAGRTGGERRWRLPAGDERLTDLAWSPDGTHLLLVASGQTLGGGRRTRLLWLDAAGGDPRALAELPSDVVAGGYAWSPDGQRISLLTRSGGLTALCLVGADGDFRYLADLAQDEMSPLPFPPVAWSPDGQRLLYAAPAQAPSGQLGWLWGGGTTIALFAADLARPVGERLGSAEGQSPTWRPDGSVVALARPKSDGPLVLRAVDAGGATHDLGPLPVTPSAAYAARWDGAHAQVLIAVRAAASLGATRPDFWLVRFAPEAAR